MVFTHRVLSVPKASQEKFPEALSDSCLLEPRSNVLRGLLVQGEAHRPKGRGEEGGMMLVGVDVQCAVMRKCT